MKKIIIDRKEIQEILNISNSNISIEEKAELLSKICSINDIENTISYYEFKKIPTNNIMKIYEIYKFFVDKGLLFRFETKYNCDFKELQNRLNILISINDTIKDKTKNDYQVSYIFLIYFNNLNAFKKTYSLIINKGLLNGKINDERMNYASEALLNYNNILDYLVNLDEKGIINDVKYVIKIENYNKYYNYAKFIIENYIKSNNSYRKKEFLNNFGIDEETFIYCIKIIEELNLYLYNKYLIKKQENYKKTIFRNQKIILDLEKGIKTGYMSNGEEFDILLFIKKIPFKNNPDFFSHIRQFINCFIPNSYQTIIDYICQNNLQNINYTKLIDEDELYNTKEIIKGHIMTNEEKEIIINYLKYRRVPIIQKTYTIARYMYLNNQLNYSYNNLEKEKIKLTLIPSNKSE